MDFFKCSISIVNDSLSTSTRIDFKPNKWITSTVAAKVKFTVITSSPGFKPRAINAICKASVPFAHEIT